MCIRDSPTPAELLLKWGGRRLPACHGDKAAQLMRRESKTVDHQREESKPLLAVWNCLHADQGFTVHLVAIHREAEGVAQARAEEYHDKRPAPA